MAAGARGKWEWLYCPRFEASAALSDRKEAAETCRRTENGDVTREKEKKKKKVDKVGHRYKDLTGLKVANVWKILLPQLSRVATVDGREFSKKISRMTGFEQLKVYRALGVSSVALRAVRRKEIRSKIYHI